MALCGPTYTSAPSTGPTILFGIQEVPDEVLDGTGQMAYEPRAMMAFQGESHFIGEDLAETPQITSTQAERMTSAQLELRRRQAQAEVIPVQSSSSAEPRPSRAPVDPRTLVGQAKITHGVAKGMTYLEACQSRKPDVVTWVNTVKTMKITSGSPKYMQCNSFGCSWMTPNLMSVTAQ